MNIIQTFFSIFLQKALDKETYVRYNINTEGEQYFATKEKR